MPPLPPDFPALTSSGSTSVVASVNPSSDTSRSCPVRQASRKSKWVPFDIETPAYVPKTAAGGRKKKHRNAPATLSPAALHSAAKPPRKPEAKAEDGVKSSTDANRERRLAQRRKKKARTGQQAQRDSTPVLPGSPRKPMSPSAVSTCSLASLLSSSSGIGSGDSSRAAIGSAADSECGIMSPKTVVSSACSTIDPVEEPKFDDDFEHFDDEDNEETVIVTPIPSLLDGFAGLTLEHHPHELPSDAEESLRSAASTTSTFDLFSANVPPPNARVNLRDPAIRRYYNQQRRFYRQIYEQQLAVYAAVAQAYSGGSENGSDGAFRGRSNSTGEGGPRRRGNVPHQHLGLPPLPPPTAVQPTYWPPPPLARAPPGYVFVPYSQLAAMASGEECWEEWSVSEEDGSTQPHQQQQQEQAAPSSTSITPPTPVTTTTTEAAATAAGEMPVATHPPHQHNSSAVAPSQSNDARSHRDQSNYHHHHHNDGGHYRHHNGGGPRHTQTISSRSLQHRHSQRSGSSSGSGGYIATPMPTSNGTAMPVPSRPASGEGTMCKFRVCVSFLI